MVFVTVANFEERFLNIFRAERLEEERIIEFMKLKERLKFCNVVKISLPTPFYALLATTNPYSVPPENHVISPSPPKKSFTPEQIARSLEGKAKLRSW